MQKNTQSSEPIRLEKGLTWVTIIALILAAVLFLPTSLYLNLVSGASVAGAAVYVIAIVFSSFGALFGRELKKQELFIIYSVVGAVAGFIPPYYWFVARSYFMKSPLSYEYKINGVPLPYLVPRWMAPPPWSPAHSLRTLLHPDWFPALLIYTIIALMSFGAQICLAIFFSTFFIEVEKLRFPLAEVDASLVISLSEREPERFKYFVASLFSGIVLSAAIYMPQILGFTLVPLPWLDLTHLTEKYLPGAVIGIATTPEPFIFGLLLPVHVTAGMLIGSIACWIFGNTLFISVFPDVYPEWSKGYFQGMSIASIYQRSQLWLWTSFQFGFSFGVTLFMLILLRKSLIKLLKFMTKPPIKMKEAVILSLPKLIVLYLVTSIGTVLIHHFLIPEYPIIVSLVTSVGISFLTSLLASVSIGELGITPTLGDVWAFVTYYSGYEGYPGWFFKPFIGFGECASIVQKTKVAYLTGTRPTDLYKALFLGYVLSLIFGLISMDMFWRMAPIPSSAYPNTMVFWPTTLMSINLWATRKIPIRSELVLSGFIMSIVLGFVGLGIQKIGIPFSLVSIATGITQLPPTTIMIFLGSLISRYFVSKVIEREQWLRIRSVVVAGLLAGISITCGLSIAISMLIKATWIRPW